jgi:hypothetical protein
VAGRKISKRFPFFEPSVIDGRSESDATQVQMIGEQDKVNRCCVGRRKAGLLAVKGSKTLMI